MRKLIIDTDIGDDIDDALAIALAVKLEAELIGITTVFKNTQQRARQAKKLFDILGVKNVPVYAGYGHPLEMQTDIEERICQYTEDLENDKFQSENPTQGAYGQAAVDFMIEMAKKYEDELIILCIGPLTNMAHAILQNRKAIEKIHCISMMGGNFYSEMREWNILCDPEAATIVMRAPVKKYCVGHDVTGQCIMNEEQTQRMLHCETKLGLYLGEILQKWIDTNKRLPILHDPLAVWTVLRDGMVEFEPISIQVELDEEKGRGMTRRLEQVDMSKVENYIYATYSVEAELFKNTYLDIIF